MKPRVLLTGAGGSAGRALAAQLKSRGIPVLGTDIRELPPKAGITVVPVPPASDPEMVSALRRLVTREGINVVIPTVSSELPLLAAYRAAFGADVRVIIGDPGPVSVAHDKLFTAWQLQSSGIPVPRFGVPSDFADAEAAMAALGGPVVVRPRLSCGAHAAVVIDGSGDVDWRRLPDGQMVQEFIPGPGYGPMVFGTPAHNGSAPFVVVVEKIELDRGAVGKAVVTRRVEVDEDMDVGNVAMAAVRSLGLAGPVDVDVRRRADGTPVVLDVNARFGANSWRAPELLDAVLASFALPSFNPASFRGAARAYAGALV
ncbi:ATP-grasp domain-containing protein [Pseudarthrobacter sp. ATCC 49987]|uniref:ATP-grasp domain-containing protein n=1 Tax=Pseudarthrobacter sp. ATCC 49987 TaxID=2698204 RepID=UPI001367F05D|nr:ATP-grasp domain-containing protein [Pseudarthrobacter sp. ATCC 49987]